MIFEGPFHPKAFYDSMILYLFMAIKIHVFKTKVPVSQSHATQPYDCDLCVWDLCKKEVLQHLGQTTLRKIYFLV